MDPFQTVIEETPQATVARMSGDAGLGGIAQLERDLNRLSAMRPGLVVLDFSGVSFIASLGLGLLTQFQRGIERRGGKVRFAALQPNVRELIENARLHELFQLHDTVDQALGGAGSAE